MGRGGGAKKTEGVGEGGVCTPEKQSGPGRRGSILTVCSVYCGSELSCVKVEVGRPGLPSLISLGFLWT